MLTRDFEAAVERAITDMYALFAGTWSLDQAKALLLASIGTTQAPWSAPR